MKNIVKIIVIVSTFFLTTGFYTLDTKVNIKDDKTVKFYAIHSVNKPIFENSEISKTKTINEILRVEELKKVLENNGYTVKDYDKENEIGIEIYKEFNSIEEISSSKSVIFNLNDYLNLDFKESKIFKSSRKGLLNTYNANFVFNTKKELEYECDYNFEVILPVKSVSNNATHISNDGLVLTWKPIKNDINEIKFDFKLREAKVIDYMLYVYIFIIVVLFSFILFKKNYKKD